jgi:hypothetical protein
VTTEQVFQLLSAALGLTGTVVLFLGSYAFQPPVGSFFGGPDTNEKNARIRRANGRRKWAQRFGLGLLCLSFFVQGLAVFVVDGTEGRVTDEAPACSNGAVECPPWARDWNGEGPPVGSVVDRKGRIMSAAPERPEE